MHPRTRNVVVGILSLMTLVAGVLITTLGVREMLRAQRLLGDTQIVNARASDWSTARSDCQLHYEFVIAGVTYSSTDATGTPGLWRSVSWDSWEASQDTGTIPVRYAPEDPWINAPMDEVPGAMGDHIAGLVLGLVLIAGAIWMPFRVRAVARMRRQQALGRTTR